MGFSCFIYYNSQLVLAFWYKKSGILGKFCEILGKKDIFMYFGLQSILKLVRK